MHPFTHDEAHEIWDDFEDLKDTEFKMGSPIVYLVHDVVVCPFPEAERVLFINRYDETRNGETSIAGYTGSGYDVLLVAYDVDDESTLTYTDIRSFAADKGISYSFPESTS